MLRIENRILRVARTLFEVPFVELDLNHMLKRRRLDVCCCGLSKTGTHSMAGIFANYRSRHHPDARVRLRLAIASLKGDLDEDRASEVLRRRDRKLWLEMESSSLAGILIEPLVQACPKKRFLLTIRDVYSWCNSWIDHNINRPPHPASGFAALDRVRLRGGDFPPTKFDAPLTALGFPSLAAYFQLWATHNARVLDAVPAERIVVLKTSEIIERIPEIASWVGAGPGGLSAERGWLDATSKKHNVLGQLDPSYVQDMAVRFCGGLMERYFPDASLPSPSRCGR